VVPCSGASSRGEGAEVERVEAVDGVANGGLAVRREARGVDELEVGPADALGGGRRKRGRVALRGGGEVERGLADGGGVEARQARRVKLAAGGAERPGAGEAVEAPLGGLEEGLGGGVGDGAYGARRTPAG
jgi:hypothetical protein